MIKDKGQDICRVFAIAAEDSGAYAVSAILFEVNGEKITEFTGRCPNMLDHFEGYSLSERKIMKSGTRRHEREAINSLQNVPMNYPCKQALLEAFAEFYDNFCVKNKAAAMVWGFGICEGSLVEDVIKNKLLPYKQTIPLTDISSCIIDLFGHGTEKKPYWADLELFIKEIGGETITKGNNPLLFRCELIARSYRLWALTSDGDPKKRKEDIKFFMRNIRRQERIWSEMEEKNS